MIAILTLTLRFFYVTTPMHWRLFRRMKSKLRFVNSLSRKNPILEKRFSPGNAISNRKLNQIGTTKKCGTWCMYNYHKHIKIVPQPKLLQGENANICTLVLLECFALLGCHRSMGMRFRHRCLVLLHIILFAQHRTKYSFSLTTTNIRERSCPCCFEVVGSSQAEYRRCLSQHANRRSMVEWSNVRMKKSKEFAS